MAIISLFNQNTIKAYTILIPFPFYIFKHKDAYQVILDGVKGGPKEKRLAAQFIPKFFSSFPELADAAINAQLDLCEDEDVSVSFKPPDLVTIRKFASFHALCPRLPFGKIYAGMANI